MLYYFKNVAALRYIIILIHCFPRLSCRLEKNVEFKVFQEHSWKIQICCLRFGRKITRTLALTYIAVGLLLVHTVLMLIDEIPVTGGNVGKMMIMKWVTHKAKHTDLKDLSLFLSCDFSTFVVGEMLYLFYAMIIGLCVFQHPYSTRQIFFCVAPSMC